MKDCRLNLRLEEDDKNLLELEAKRLGCSSAAVMRKAIALYFSANSVEKKVAYALADKTTSEVKKLRVQVNMLSSLLTNYVRLFIFASPQLKEDFSKTNGFLSSYSRTVKWFKTMTEKKVFGDHDFLSKIEDLLMLRTFKK